jgi:Uma2 family endonuclease
MPDPPDASRQELVCGIIITIPPPGGLHGAVCSRISRRLGNFVEANKLGTVTCNGTGFISARDPDTVRGPDISFWSRERLPEVPEGYIEVPPDLAIEVVSPNDHYSRVQQKVRHHLSHGVRLVWVVDPMDRSVTVYRSLQQAIILQEKEIIAGEDELSGFSCLVADFFP